MEKQRNTKRRRFVSGLLIILFSFCTGNLWAAPKITSAQIRELKIKPAPNEKLITDTEIKFELEIPTIKPANVEITTPVSTEDILFKTFRKTATENGGTKIELWYEFSKSGEVKPESLSVKISNRNYKIPFEYISIEENPLNLLPRMVFKFSNGKSASTEQKYSSSALFSTPVSKTIKISVFVQYTNQISRFNYAIPKNSLFQNTKIYEILERMVTSSQNTENITDQSDATRDISRTVIVSHNLIPVADFEWTPIAKGKASLPEIKMIVTSYAGNQVELKTPATFISVISRQTGKSTDNITAFENQFDETVLESDETQIQSIDTFSEIKKKRKLCQKLIIVSLSLLSVFLLITILTSSKIKKSKIAKKIFSASILLTGISIICLTIFTVILKQPVAIYMGGIVNSIPEETAGNHIQIMENTKVKIVKKTSDWYCIQTNGNVGWTKKENVLWI